MKNLIEKVDKRVLTGMKIAIGVFLIITVLFIGFGVRASSYALNYADLTKTDVSYVRFGFEFDDFLPEYDVKWNIGRTEYEYTVHALTGEILGIDIDKN